MSNPARNMTGSTVILIQEQDDPQHKCMREFCSSLSLMLNSFCCNFLQCMWMCLQCLWVCIYGFWAGWKVQDIY